MLSVKLFNYKVREMVNMLESMLKTYSCIFEKKYGWGENNKRVVREWMKGRWRV